MGWEKRGSGMYYYRKRRIGGRVVSEYVGGGVVGELAALQGECDRFKRVDQRKADRLTREEMRTLDRQVDEVAELIRAVTQGVLLATGHHTHKGQWRKRRDG